MTESDNYVMNEGYLVENKSSSFFFTILIACIILWVFFLRGEIFEGFSVTLLLPPLVMFTFILICIRTVKIVAINKNLGLFFIAILINQYINLCLTQEYILIARFSLEILLNAMIYYVIFAVVSFNLVTTASLLRSIQLTSLILLPPIFLLVSQLDSVRRIGARDAWLPIAVNHMGHALAIACMISLYFVIKSYEKKRYLSFFLNILLTGVISAATFLSGSKAAIFSVMLFVFLWAVMRFRFWFKRVLYILPFLALLFVITFVTGSEGKFNPLINRLGIERIETGIQQRIDTFSNAWQARTSDSSVLLGESWRYEPINKINPIPYPHNFFLSILLYTGFLPLIFFSMFTLNRLFIYFLNMCVSSNSDLWVLFNSMVYSVLIYALTSGRLTRIITIFLVFAIVEGYLRRKRNTHNPLFSISAEQMRFPGQMIYQRNS